MCLRLRLFEREKANILYQVNIGKNNIRLPAEVPPSQLNFCKCCWLQIACLNASSRSMILPKGRSRVNKDGVN